MKYIIADLPVSQHGNPRIIIAGLYPPAQSLYYQQHDNTTSRAMQAALGHLYFDWIDIHPYSPNNTNADFSSIVLSRH